MTGEVTGAIQKNVTCHPQCGVAHRMTLVTPIRATSQRPSLPRSIGEFSVTKGSGCPDVAKALDGVLPAPEDELTKAFRASIERWDAAATAKAATNTPSTPAPNPSQEPPKPPAWVLAGIPDLPPGVPALPPGVAPRPPSPPEIKLTRMSYFRRGEPAPKTALARKMVRLAERLHAAGDAVSLFRAELIHRLLHSLPTLVVEDPAWAIEQGVPRHLHQISHLLGMEFPDANWCEIENMIKNSLVAGNTLVVYFELYEQYEQSFRAGAALRLPRSA